MQKQQILIDNRYFVFECLAVGKKQDPEFTYKTDKKKMPKIVQDYFEILKILGNINSFQKEMTSNNWHYHKVEGITQLELIRKIFKAANKEENWIDQHIITGVIYQVKFLNNSSCRLFFHQKNINNGEYLIIQPLFLDVNHLIFNDEKFDKVYNSCLICHGKRCS